MRSFLLAVAVVSLLGSVCDAATPRKDGRVRFAQLQFDSGAVAQRWALVAWAQEVRLRTSIEVSQEPVSVSLATSDLFAHPLLYWAGDSAFDKLPEAAIARLRRHLGTGGVLIIDDTGRSGPSAGFDRSIRRAMRRAFGPQIHRISPNHVIFRSFYRLAAPVGRRNSVRHIEGVKIGDRYAVIYIRNDLQGAFARSPTGGPARRVIPGGEAQREQAYRLGINLVMYALCLEYKDDHAHVTKLLRHRRGARHRRGVRHRRDTRRAPPPPPPSRGK